MDLVDIYFDNLQAIENKWKECRETEFSQMKRDELWKLCNDGRNFFNLMDLDWKGDIVKVPAYERAVMLLEHEGRYQAALKLCREANKLKINTDWYDKRIKKLSKKVSN